MTARVLLTLALLAAPAAADPPKDAPRPAGFLADPDIVPIAVWLQSPARAADYKALGINLYVGLWRGPTEDHLAELKKHGMRVICAQNAVGRKHLDDPTVVGWMHGDEPDNAQSLGKGKGYGPPVPPAKVAEDYERLKTADPLRPVLLNFGQGVAWDRWVGRGTRTNHPEDYPDYLKGCDIASFDIYPAVHDQPDVAGKLWFVADGVGRLRKWTDGRKPVWACVECTHVSNPKVKPTPGQVKAEVWMALVRGARGVIYFAHQFQPRFVEAGLLEDKEMAAAVGAINKQVRDLAPVLNGPAVADGVTVKSSAAAVPVEAVAKRRDGATYVFAVGMRDRPTAATFTVAGRAGRVTAEVLGEGRTVEVRDGVFRDEFGAWGVHLYRIPDR
jgi:hypothetical protein